MGFFFLLEPNPGAPLTNPRWGFFFLVLRDSELLVLALEEAESEGEMSEAPSHCSRLMMAWLSTTSKPSFSTLLSASGRDAEGPRR